MRSFLVAATVLAAGGSILAQDFAPTVNIAVEARVDYQRQYLDGDVDDSGSGFKGRYLNVLLNGDINSHFSYSYRQRLNKTSADQTFFDATDWIYINYKPTDRWTLSTGKQVVAIGGYEYDKAPIDIYRASEFWNNVPCYQMGVSGAYNFKNGKDQLLFQICESPFHTSYNSNMYAYNLEWYGNHGWFNSIYSANIIETSKNRYISYIALGNEFNAGPATLQLDLMNRAASHQTYFFKDCSVMAELSYKVSDPVKIFAKATYDVNRTDTSRDQLVLSGTEMKMAGIGAEYHALKATKQDIRVHAYYFYSWGTNSNPSGTLLNKMSLVDVGVKWRVNFLTAKKK
jgi:hypothetical protein